VGVRFLTKFCCFWTYTWQHVVACNRKCVSRCCSLGTKFSPSYL